MVHEVFPSRYLCSLIIPAVDATPFWQNWSTSGLATSACPRREGLPPAPAGGHGVDRQAVQGTNKRLPFRQGSPLYMSSPG